MKQALIIFLFLFSLSTLNAQKQVQLEEISNSIGDSITIKGKVFTTRYLENSKGAPTLLNIGAAFPNQLVTVVIFGDDRGKFTQGPEIMFADKTISVTGKVTIFRDKPQIVISSLNQIKVEEEKK